jgi:hypothetical protein
VLDGLRAELNRHRSWVGVGYEPGNWPDPKDPLGWWARERLREMKESTPFVNKLSTVAIDAAIAQGPALFINRSLVVALVQYRQRVSHLNQLVDNALAFAASTELWRTKPPEHPLADHFAELTAAIHWVGVGTSDRDGAHAWYIVATVQLMREVKVRRFDWLAWFWVGRTLPRPKAENTLEPNPPKTPKTT